LRVSAKTGEQTLGNRFTRRSGQLLPTRHRPHRACRALKRRRRHPSRVALHGRPARWISSTSRVTTSDYQAAATYGQAAHRHGANNRNVGTRL